MPTMASKTMAVRVRERASMVQYNRAAICTLQHYGKCSKEKEERGEREGAIMLRDSSAK